MCCLDFVVPLPLSPVLLGNSVSVPAYAAEEVRKRFTRDGGFGQQSCVGSNIGKKVSGHYSVPALFT